LKYKKLSVKNSGKEIFVRKIGNIRPYKKIKKIPLVGNGIKSV
jgi:hypothetical protein